MLADEKRQKNHNAFNRRQETVSWCPQHEISKMKNWYIKYQNTTHTVRDYHEPETVTSAVLGISRI